MEKYDLTIIGAGPGGYPAAIRASQLGLSTALVEKEKLGGTCLNWGCIPTKTLIHSSALFWNMKHLGRSGINTGDISFDYAAMAERKNGIVKKLHGGIAQLLKANGIKVFDGVASFKGRNRISVKNNKGLSLINTSNTIIASGSTPMIPCCLPKTKAILDSRSFLDITSMPGSMIVMGGGVIGCEFACMAAQLGVNVTIVEILPDILAMLDADVRAEARRHMEGRLKIRIMTGKPIKDIAAGQSGVKGRVGNKEIRAEMLVAAAGRRPVTDKLGLNAAGVTTDANGFIETDDGCRTRASSVYAVGDVTEGPQLAHYATAQGLMAVEQIAGASRRRGLGVVPSCIFTAPEIGTAGLSEQDARSQNRDIAVGKFAFAASGKAMAGDDTSGFVKWIADSSTDQLLGAQAIGPHATELIAEAALAIQFELTSRELGRTVHAHPSLSEAWMEAAHAVHGECIHAMPGKRRAHKGKPRE